MSPREYLASAPQADHRQPVAVRMPQRHDGLNRALRSSFGDIPPMTEELDRLLARLR